MKTLSKRTKIVATIGPSSESPEMMERLMSLGVNVFRFNMKHGDVEWHNKFIRQAREVANKINHDLGVLIDLQGPEIRIKTFNQKVLNIKKNDQIKFTSNIDLLNDNENIIYTSSKNIVSSLEKGDRIVIDDGALFLDVSDKSEEFVTLVSQSESPLKNNKSMNLIGKDVDLPSLTEEDKVRLTVAQNQKVDFIALSFVREKKDLDFLKEEMKSKNIEAKIVSKIESQKGINNIDEIIDNSYAIMVARGDLGIETPIEGVTYIQKILVKKCRMKSKPVIVATQMLESMINSKFPTRAEAADVSNAVFDYTDAVMLSGETAYGANPAEVVEVMARICSFNETVRSEAPLIHVTRDNTSYIAEAGFNISKDHNINKIIALTETGYTVRVLSALRPRADIIAVSDVLDTVNLLSLSGGVKPFKTKYAISDLSSYEKIIDELKQANLVESGETVVAIHGQKFGMAGGTNSLIILTI
jgi:pyruvate kinase